jgi:UDP-glucose:(heptosyl)LPS alpha-1,3-glucosyltransferase
MVKNVAIIIERADLNLGGAERSMLEVAEALSALGIEVDLLAAKAGASADTAIDVRALCGNIPGKRVSLEVFGQALRRYLAQAHYDIIHSVLPFDFADLYQPRGGAYAESARRHIASYPCPVARLCKRLTAFTNRRRGELLQAERRLCQGSRGPVIAALSHYVAEQFQRHYATAPKRLALVLNGVKTDRSIDANIISRLRREVATQLGRREGDQPVLFLFVAHNFRLKGLHPLLRALRQVGDSAAERPACLVVVGSDKGRAERRLARQLGLDNRVVFLGPIANIQNALALADVGILPTFYDPSSRFILEALGAGKPVITTRFNGAADHFTDGRHGKVIDAPGDITALAEAIRHFTDPVKIEEAARAIREDDLASRISIRRVAQETLGLYQSILSAREGRTGGYGAAARLSESS